MNIYDQQPPVAATTKTLTDYVTYFCFDTRELTDEERKANEIPDTEADDQGNVSRKEAWTAHTVAYRHEQPLTEGDYGKMVTAIVRSKYSADDVEAILNNYAADKDRYQQEFDTLQDWRNAAKEAARGVLNA